MKKQNNAKENPQSKEEKLWIEQLLSDSNNINEKTIVGFISFFMMIIISIFDLFTGDKLPINEFIFDGFLWVTLGGFGIASVDSFIAKKTGSNSTESSNRKRKRYPRYTSNNSNYDDLTP